MAAHPQARRGRGGRAGTRRTHPRSVKSGRTNDEVRDGRAPRGSRRSRPAGGRDRPVGRSRGAHARLHPADAGDPGGRRLRRPRLAVRGEVGRLPGRGGRARRRARLWTRNQRTRRATSPSWPGRRPGSRRARRSSTARWWRSTPTGRPSFSLLQDRTGHPHRPRRRASKAPGPAGAGRLPGLRPAPPRRSSLLSCRSRSASGCCAAPAPASAASGTPPTSSGTAWRSPRRRARQELEGIVAKLRRSPYEPGRRSRTG